MFFVIGIILHFHNYILVWWPPSSRWKQNISLINLVFRFLRLCNVNVIVSNIIQAAKKAFKVAVDLKGGSAGPVKTK